MTHSQAAREHASTDESPAFYLPASPREDGGLLARLAARLFRRRGDLGWHRRNE